MTKAHGCLFVLLIISFTLSAQFGNDSIRMAQKKGLLLPYPVLGYAPETKFQYGVGAVYSFYTDKTSPKTRSSAIYSYNMLTTESQIQLILQGSIWTKDNVWHFFTSGIYSDFPIYFYGIGSHTKEADADLITAKRFRFVAGAERKVIEHLYVGAGLGLQSDDFTDAAPGGIFDTGKYVGKQGGKLALLGYQVVFDNRDFENYTTKGYYLKAGGWSNFGYSDWRYTFFTIDGRYFTPVGRNQTLGFQGVFQTTQGKDIPFYSLSNLGGSSYLRGYYMWRYSDQNLVAAQSEYRYRPWGLTRDRGFVSASRIIFSAFAGTGTVFPNTGFSWNDLFPSFGGGVSYMFDPLARLTLRLNYAVGSKKTNEDRSTGFYVSLNEAF